jgi:maleate isomerase
MTRALLGILTPSSNTILEPVTAAILAGLPETSAHFSRFSVTRIALSDGANAQFEFEPMLAAARLLADAKVGVIAWSGTSASWLGFERDRALCDLITKETGIVACTSVLALNELLTAGSVRRLGLVSPYSREVQDAIVANYARAGIEVVAEAHAGISDNYAFSEIGDDEVGEMCRSVAKLGAEAIVIMCTNMRGARLAHELETELGIPVYDSSAAVVWQALALLGIDTRRVAGWGGMFHKTCPRP